MRAALTVRVVEVWLRCSVVVWKGKLLQEENGLASVESVVTLPCVLEKDVLVQGCALVISL